MKQNLKDKRLIWQEIQEKAPDLAVFMAALQCRFGKVKLLSVVFCGDKADGKR